MTREYTTMMAVAGACILAVAGCQSRSSEGEAGAQPKTSEKKAAAPDQGSERGREQTDAEKSLESGPPTSLDELPDGVNAVQNEMQYLNTAMQNTLTLIANDALGGIPAQIKKVHPARQLTAKALEQGRYEPPVNAHNMEAFKELDEKFHRDLKGLLKASKEDDLQKATEQYGKLVDSCTNCHTQFRFK